VVQPPTRIVFIGLYGIIVPDLGIIIIQEQGILFLTNQYTGMTAGF